MKKNLKSLFSPLFFGKTNKLSIQIIRYFFIGGVAFIIDFSILFFMTSLLNVNYLISAGIAFILGLIVNFALSISWIFNKGSFSWGSLAGKYFLVFIFTGLIGLGLNQFFIYAFTEFLNMNYLVSKLITVPLVLLWNFFSRKILI